MTTRAIWCKPNGRPGFGPATRATGKGSGWGPGRAPQADCQSPVSARLLPPWYRLGGYPSPSSTSVCPARATSPRQVLDRLDGRDEHVTVRRDPAGRAVLEVLAAAAPAGLVGRRDR